MTRVNGGGTNWNITETEYDALLAQFYCVEREHSYGVPSASLAAELFPLLRDRRARGAAGIEPRPRDL